MLTTLLPIDGGSATSPASTSAASRPGCAALGYVSQLGGADELATGRENLTAAGPAVRGQPGRRRPAGRRRCSALLDLAGFAGPPGADTTRAASAAASTWRSASCTSPRSCSWTSRAPGWTRRTGRILWEHIRGLRDRGTTVFLTTHYLDEADALCDRIMIIDHGTVVAEGTPRALKQQVAGDAIAVVTRDAGRRPGAPPPSWPGSPAWSATSPWRAPRSGCTPATARPRCPGCSGCSTRAGLPVRSLRLSEPSLDDVFLRQTGRSLRDAGDAAAPAPEHAATEAAA